MAKKNKPKSDVEVDHEIGNGGETHQQVGGEAVQLTTDQGTPVSDNQNSLVVGPRGPILIEDFVMREKITSFDHERIPERVVHARFRPLTGIFSATNRTPS